MRKHRIRHYCGTGFGNGAGCGASALSGLRFNATKMVNYLDNQLTGGFNKPRLRYSSG